jgi:hypothetical protein
MGYYLKRRDVIIRPTSTITRKEVYKHLENEFTKLQKEDKNGNIPLYYASVFDSRTNEYYYYYSNKAVEIYNLGRNVFDIIGKNNVTSENFVKIFLNNISEIVTALKTYFSYGMFKIKTLTTIVPDDKKIKIDNIEGDIINNVAYVKIDKENDVYEERLVELNKDNEVILDDDTIGDEITFSYLERTKEL